jgi:CRP/FNR family transcriptional regulator, cyclic AMP receptor protein
LDIHADGEVFGEAGLARAARAEMAVAIGFTVVRQITRERLLGALQCHGLVAEFMTCLAARLADQQVMITDFVTADSEQRLAATLLRLGRKLGTREGSSWRIRDRISCQDLSEMVGTTRSRIGFFLKRFESDGLVESCSDAFLVVREPQIHEYLRNR